MTGVQLPDASAEAASTVDADDIYKDAVARLREMTRDHERFPRVWSELKQYGAARNMYGAKPVALGAAGLTVLLSAGMTVASWLSLWNVSWVMPVIAGVLGIMIGLGWLFIVTPQYVRVASDRYSDALLEVPNEQGAAPQ